MLKVFIVWDTEKECMWYTPGGKFIWMKAPYAKNAWNVKQPWRAPKFNEQTRYTIKMIELDPDKGKTV